MRIMLEYAVDVKLNDLDAKEYALWNIWTREVVEAVAACQTSEGFFAKDSLGRNIEVREEEQRRLGTPLLRDFETELFKNGYTDLRDYAVRVYYDEDEES